MRSKDSDTDNAIQEALRKELALDVTVLTVAHRIQTVMDADKIVCLAVCLLVYFYSWFSRWCSMKGGLYES